MPDDWKQEHADAAERAVYHPLVQDTIREFLRNIGRPDGKLERYGLLKVASAAAQVARAEALGIDPDTLRLTDAEAAAVMLQLARVASGAGKPVIGVVVPERQGDA